VYLSCRFYLTCPKHHPLSYQHRGQAMEEIWKPVEGFDGYEVSDLGRVRKVDGNVVNLFNHPQGYLKVALKVAGQKVSKKYVHRLVAAAFIPNPDNLPYVNHKNGKQWCNEVDNLEWISSKDNQIGRAH